MPTIIYSQANSFVKNITYTNPGSISPNFRLVIFRKFYPIPRIISPPIPEMFAYISAVMNGSAHTAKNVKPA